MRLPRLVPTPHTCRFGPRHARGCSFRLALLPVLSPVRARPAYPTVPCLLHRAWFVHKLLEVQRPAWPGAQAVPRCHKAWPRSGVALELSRQCCRYECVIVPAPNTQLPTRHPEKGGFKSQGLRRNLRPPRQSFLPLTPSFFPFPLGSWPLLVPSAWVPRAVCSRSRTPTACHRAGLRKVTRWSGTDEALTAAHLFHTSQYFPNSPR